MESAGAKYIIQGAVLSRLALFRAGSRVRSSPGFSMMGLGESRLASLVSATSTTTTLLDTFAIAECTLLELHGIDGSWGGSSGTVLRQPTSSVTEVDRSMT